jgi:hypothetical protein
MPVDSSDHKLLLLDAQALENTLGLAWLGLA